MVQSKFTLVSFSLHGKYVRLVKCYLHKNLYLFILFLFHLRNSGLLVEDLGEISGTFTQEAYI